MLQIRIFVNIRKKDGSAKEIGQLKSDNNVAILQNKRWNEILER